jgi:hypothetical protein
VNLVPDLLLRKFGNAGNRTVSLSTHKILVIFLCYFPSTTVEPAACAVETRVQTRSRLTIKREFQEGRLEFSLISEVSKATVLLLLMPWN